VHTAAVVQEWLPAHSVELIQHPLYLPDLAPADFFLFQRVKEQLKGLTLDQNKIKKMWEGSREPLPWRSLPLPSGGGTSTAKSASRSAVTMSKKAEK
jgi:hypothetical protein